MGECTAWEHELLCMLSSLLHLTSNHGLWWLFQLNDLWICTCSNMCELSSVLVSAPRITSSYDHDINIEESLVENVMLFYIE